MPGTGGYTASWWYQTYFDYYDLDGDGDRHDSNPEIFEGIAAVLGFEDDDASSAEDMWVRFLYIYISLSYSYLHAWQGILCCRYF